MLNGYIWCSWFFYIYPCVWPGHYQCRCRAIVCCGWCNLEQLQFLWFIRRYWRCSWQWFCVYSISSFLTQPFGHRQHGGAEGEFAEYYNDMSSQGMVFKDDRFSDPSVLGKETNWQDAIFRV